MAAIQVSSSRYEVPPQSLGHRVDAIAHAKFHLRIFQMAADRLPTNPECLCHFAGSGSGRGPTQDGNFTGRQPGGRLLCTRPGRVTCSRRSAEKLAAAKIRLRICCCRIFSERVLRDQKMITHLPPTGQQKASRIPYLRNKSSDHRSFPVGSNTCFASDHVHGVMLDCARNSSRRNLPRATASYSSHQPLGTPLCRKMESPS